MNELQKAEKALLDAQTRVAELKSEKVAADKDKISKALADVVTLFAELPENDRKTLWKDEVFAGHAKSLGLHATKRTGGGGNKTGKPRSEVTEDDVYTTIKGLGAPTVKQVKDAFSSKTVPLPPKTTSGVTITKRINALHHAKRIDKTDKGTTVILKAI